MGEEEKKTEKMEEKKKTEEPKKPEKKEEPKSDDKKAEGPKDSPATAPPPPPPQEIVLKVYMHCDGCAKKVRRWLKGFPGVENVQTDCKTNKVVVKGEKADPVKVLERVQEKSHRQVELLSPIPKPPAPAEKDAKKAEEKIVAKPAEKKEEPKVIVVVLKVYMHCEACAQEIKRRIGRMAGVENVEPDLKSSQVTVKGVFDPPKLVEYVYKRTKKHAVIVKQEPEKKEEEKKAGDGGKKEAEKGKEEAKEKSSGSGDAAPAPAVAPVVGTEEGANVVEMKKNEFYYNYPLNYQIYPDPDPRFDFYGYQQQYPPERFDFYGHHQQQYPPERFDFYGHHQQQPSGPPQMFSDENPNACTVM